MWKAWRLFILLLCIFSIGACRYWSLYRFGQQFCEYEEHVEVLYLSKQVEVRFLEPVLPQSVFQRYLAAEPFSSSSDDYIISDRYQFVSDDSEKALSFSVDHSKGLSKPLMAAGRLGENLSKVFSISFVDSVLASVCSDDFDLSTKELDFRMSLNAIVDMDRPTRIDTLAVFGSPLRQSQSGKHERLEYKFNFIREDGSQQDKEIELHMTFAETQVMSAMYVQYHKYTLWLDLDERKARLHVDRRK